MTDFLEKRRTAALEDDFFTYTDAQLWTKTLTGAATAPTLTNPNSSSGVLSLGNVSNQANSSALVVSTIKPFIFAANRPMYMECELQYTEANTNTSAIFFGMASAFGPTFLADTTTLPIATGSAVGIYKLTGETTWKGMVNVNGVQTLTGTTLESSQPSPTTTFQRLAIKVDAIGSTNMEITFFVGQRDTPGADAFFPAGLTQMREATSGFNKPLKIRVSNASAVAMAAGFMIKQITVTNPETLVMDYVSFSNLRT